jgi:membrane protease YdiL (CAAX protease family)
MTDHAQNGRDITAIALAFEGGLGLLALIVCWWMDRWPLPGVEFTSEQWPAQAQAVLWGAIATMPMLAGMWILDRFPVGPLMQLKTDFEQRIAPLFAGCTLFQLLLISLFAGFGEELLFRGLIQAGLGEWINRPAGVWIALGIASLLFGLAHMVSATYAVVAALIGAYLGVLLILTDNVLAPIVAHGLYDFVALIYLVRGAGDGRLP